ncbi:dephospho-CoA kinase [Streptococcus gallolyticus subsp. gallolyticus]|jgi:dephospho-CoA kinase|uniref:Dephospho-CoA kinase n=3 Tax=Lactobacillales TaxID=186826 RepID=A0A139QNP0_9STRE|nr:dephospho-CoA kinase [Streptococcus gallolyticus]EFM28952.1 dephospho-CoA kinase [Streptococcus gallolyticus subsp. gallolyticus TX20005]MCR5052292.1 dephospho-CoA kinase [Streptococcus sp.]KJE99360.1 dephospho-CoA kinase [Streptococcus gallolyticus subsp. gallolyticus]KXT72318.1 Dephospho-CoA kinase [Streptococcus gallolyticus]KXU04156.1 Dephospho-CoA kinase [Streptococcus gallolyticus]
MSKTMTKIIGITGGIASGKSTVVAEIRKQGYQVIDADQVVHELQEKGGKLYQTLVEWLGNNILQENGELDRQKLGQVIFGNKEMMAKSSRLQNEIIRQELANRRNQLAQTEEVFFMDIPLLIELDYMDWFDEVWLVYVDEKTQLDRLVMRNHYTRSEAQKRIASQMSTEAKKAYADKLLDNRGNLQALKEQVDRLLHTLSD